MRFSPSPRLLQVGREDKEAQLKSFAAAGLAGCTPKAGKDKGGLVTVVARAPDSPVIRALEELAAELRSGGVGVRAILMDLDGIAGDSRKAGFLEMTGVEIRLLHDIRFAAAHEQLQLGPSMVWVGDCMRRDPAKRDAFEIFYADNAAAARHAEISFNRLWVKAKPVLRAKALAPEAVIAGKKSAEGKAERRSAPRR